MPVAELKKSEVPEARGEAVLTPGRWQAKRRKHHGQERAEGDLDFRGTLGVAKDAPVGFRDIRLSFDLDTDATPEQLATLYKLTERYCVIYQTLKNPPPLALNAA